TELQPLQGAGTQEAVEEQPLAGSAEFVLAQQQLLPDRQQYLLEHQIQRIAGEHPTVGLLQLIRIEFGYRLAHLLLPLDPLTGNGLLITRRGLGSGRRGTREDAADLAHRYAALDPGQDAAHLFDVRL